jgi:hypothetical protein
MHTAGWDFCFICMCVMYNQLRYLINILHRNYDASEVSSICSSKYLQSTVVELSIKFRFWKKKVPLCRSKEHQQGDQIGRNFAIWAKFCGIGRIFSRKKSPNDLGEILTQKKSPKIHLNNATICVKKSRLNIFIIKNSKSHGLGAIEFHPCFQNWIFSIIRHKIKSFLICTECKTSIS